MKIAILSDIHGNCSALDAVLADLEREQIDQIVCLGDAIQRGPQPVQVVDRLRQLAFPVVMGNADAWLLSGVETGAEPIDEERHRELEAVRLWSLGQLSPADQAFIRTFQPTVTLPIDDERKLLCFHGSPHSFDDLILPKTTIEELRAFFGNDEQTFFCGGHTHMQQIRHLGSTFFFNPGSVGYAWRHNQDPANFKVDRWAEYAIFTVQGARVNLELRRIPYDVKAFIEVLRTSGRPFAEVAIRQLQ